MLPEKAKPVVLLLALACIVNSFFNSDVFKRGEKAGFIYVRLYEDLACQNRKEEVRDECKVALDQALVPAKLSCLPCFRDLSVCRDPLEGKSENSCPKENQQLAECFQTHLGPHGFSDEEIVWLLFGRQQRPKKQKPSLDVTGGEEISGQAKKSDKGEEATGNEVHVENEAPAGGGKPTAEVDQGSEKGKHFRGR